MQDEFMAQPGTPLFQAEEKAPSESPSEKQEATSQAVDEVEEVPNDLDERPLHKEKRFKQVIEERNRIREEKEQLLEELAEARKPQAPIQPAQSKPEWFKRYFGDDDEAWQGFQSMTQSAKEEAKKEAVAEYEALQEEAKSREKAASDWVEEQLTGLREEEGEYDRNALLKVMEKYKPTDEEGNLDFKAGLEILRLQPSDEKEKSKARQKIADRLNPSRSSVPAQKREYVTSADIRKMRERGEI